MAAVTICSDFGAPKYEVWHCFHGLYGPLLLYPFTFWRTSWLLLSSIIMNKAAVKVWKVKAMAFPVVTYGCESWIIKKPEHQRIDAFELWCWRRLLRLLWTARRLNKSILKEINPGYSLEGLMLKLKLQYCGHLIWRVDPLERFWCQERLKAKGEGGSRGWDG